MKTLVLLVATLPMLFGAEAIPTQNLQHVAVIDFEADPGLESSLGTSVAAIVRVDLALLPPLAVVEREQVVARSADRGLGFSQTASREALADIGRRNGAVALVTGRVFAKGDDVILTAKVINVDTGVTDGAMVHGARFAELNLVSALSMKIAAIVTRQSEAEAASTWAPASIRGTQRKTSWLIFSESQTASVLTIDGQPVSRNAESWDRDLALSPGRHMVVARWTSGDAAASAHFICDARPATKYEVRAETSAKDNLKLWIEDLAAGQPATPIAVGAPEIDVSNKVIDTRMLPLTGH